MNQGVSYNCDQCDYKTTRKDNLKRHKLTKHEGVSYNCDQCDYKAKTKDRLKRHKLSKHQSYRFKCQQCELTFAREHVLARHVKRVHEREHMNQCEYCDHHFTTKASTRAYIKTILKNKLFLGGLATAYECTT